MKKDLCKCCLIWGKIDLHSQVIFQFRSLLYNVMGATVTVIWLMQIANIQMDFD